MEFASGPDPVNVHFGYEVRASGAENVGEFHRSKQRLSEGVSFGG
jgi:hypothetical protein